MTFDEALAKSMRFYDETAAKLLAEHEETLRGEGFDEEQIAEAIAFAREHNVKARQEYMTVTRGIMLTLNETWHWPSHPQETRIQ